MPSKKRHTLMRVRPIRMDVEAGCAMAVPYIPPLGNGVNSPPAETRADVGVHQCAPFRWNLQACTPAGYTI